MASDLRPIEKAPLDGRRLLGALLQQRRSELGYTHRPAFARDRLPVTPSGNLNTRLVADLEEAYRDTFPEGRLRQLAQAYLVSYESVIAVAHGHARAVAPLPAAAPSPAAVTQLPPVAGAERRGSDYPYFTAIEKRLRDLAARGITDPSGAQVFPASPDDARTWDGIGSRLDIDDRAWLIADLQRRADGRNGDTQSGEA